MLIHIRPTGFRLRIDFAQIMRKLEKKASAFIRRAAHKMKVETYKGDDNAQKDIYQLIDEKYISSPDSIWFDSDVLFVTPILKKNITVVKQAPPQAQPASKTERFVAYLKRKDITSLFVASIILKDKEVEIKQTLDMKLLKAIDFGSDEKELLLSFDTTDHTIIFQNQNTRDEIAWITVQLCKGVIGNDVSVGYSIDIEALAFTISNNGTLGRYPALQKLIKVTNNADIFSDEEAEAEHLLDELNWSSATGGKIDVQQSLSKQSEKLNYEIIDFLLQWEEMDDGSAPPTSEKSGSSGQASVKSGPQAAITSMISKPLNAVMGVVNNLTNTVNGGNSGSVAANSKYSVMSSMKKITGVRDTREVLTALASVDKELEAVDKWLGEQIERLSVIQSNLHTIEDESSVLETTWHNLNKVQEVVNLLVQGYTIHDRHSEVITRLELFLQPIIKSTNILSIDHHITPIVEAVAAVRRAQTLRMGNLQGVTLTQWKQLQTIAAVAAQKEKLANLAKAFTRSFAEFAQGLFDIVLKHKTFNDPAQPLSLATKQLNLTTLIQEFVMMKGKVRYFELQGAQKKAAQFRNTADTYDPEQTQLQQQARQQHILRTQSGKFYDMEAEKNNIMLRVLRNGNNNQVLALQQMYHSVLSKFAPLLGLYIELSSAALDQLRDSYKRSTQERFYGPFLKMLFKELQTSFKSSCVGMASMHSYKLKERFESAVAFDVNGSGGSTALAPWMVLRVILVVLAPVLQQEEAFVKATFRFDARRPGAAGPDLAMDPMVFQSTPLGIFLNALFPTLAQRIEAAVCRSSNSGADVDGLEAVAMLVVLQQFEHVYIEAVQAEHTKLTEEVVDTDADDILEGITSAAEPQTKSNSSLNNVPAPALLFVQKLIENLRSIFLQRIHNYVAEQISWIQSQKGDPKSPNVLLPFVRFPSFILNVLQMTHGMSFDCVDDMLMKIAKELINWLMLQARQSDKYVDKIKMVHFTYFEHAIAPLHLHILESFLAYATQQKQESTVKYVNWMVSYEFPALSSLAQRLDGVGSRVNDEELSLYIRRKDILNVIKEIDLKTLETNIATMRKRLEKHFKSDFDYELHLVSNTWTQIKDRVVSILARLETAASVSYQLKLEVGPAVARSIFEKFANI